MTGDESEQIFRNYLKRYSFEYVENYVVGDPLNPKNVDFLIKSRRLEVYADVKEVKASSEGVGLVDAQNNIRKDIRRLREKFGQNKPGKPIILVTMNFSAKFFTGFTIARALLGEVGALFNESGRTPIRHLSRGSAVLTQTHNRIISGVLGFDRIAERHFLFKSPFAAHPVPGEFFPSVQIIELDRNADESELIELSKIMFNEG